MLFPYQIVLMTTLDVTQALHCIDNSVDKRCVPALEDSYHTTGHARGWAVILSCNCSCRSMLHTLAAAKAANKTPCMSLRRCRLLMLLPQTAAKG